MYQDEVLKFNKLKIGDVVLVESGRIIRVEYKNEDGKHGYATFGGTLINWKERHETKNFQCWEYLDKIKFNKFDHGTYLGIRGMTARYGSMYLEEYQPIFMDMDGLTDKQGQAYFDKLEKAGYLRKRINRKGEAYYTSVLKGESRRVREIKNGETVFFDELEDGNDE